MVTFIKSLQRLCVKQLEGPKGERKGIEKADTTMRTKLSAILEINPRLKIEIANYEIVKK